jgi:hypothetical protein
LLTLTNYSLRILSSYSRYSTNTFNRVISSELSASFAKL